MSAPESRSPLVGIRHAGRFGADRPDPLRIAERPAAIVQIAARRGRAAACAGRLRQALSLDLPVPGRSAAAGDLVALWIQPDAWLVVGPRGVDGDLARRLADAAGDAASVVDQSHGKTVLTLSGGAARDVMAKGCRLDLHPQVFPTGSTAVTQIAAIGCIVHRTDDAPTFALIVPSSLAESFWDWLTVSAAEFGYQTD